LNNGVQKRGSDARVPFERGNEGQLALIVFQPVCHEPDRQAVTLRDEAGKREHVEQFAAAGLKGAAELGSHERLCPEPVGLPVTTDQHGERLCLFPLTSITLLDR
jgi:hypothetical protein